jgi:hypothetical protein
MLPSARGLVWREIYRGSKVNMFPEMQVVKLWSHMLYNMTKLTVMSENPKP